MRLPRPLYHRGCGRLLGHTFLLITHEGRKTGKPHETVAMALAYDPETQETVVCSAREPNTQWLRNRRAHPALQVQIGREAYMPEQRFLSEGEAVREFVRGRRYVTFRTAPDPKDTPKTEEKGHDSSRYGS